MTIKPERIILHHTADPSAAPQFDKVNAYHQERGFPRSSLGYFVGYHYLIEPSGTVRQARLDTEIGAHDTGENINSIGICLAGDFTTILPNEQQAAAAAQLAADLHSRWKIPVTRFEPHRWDDKTECPGQALPDNWLIEQYLKRESGQFARFFWEVGKYFNWL